ncbi:hypothetical protein Vau01_028460 [Virgisporangium aurantiacum]|uniref:Uncharacterized protein n=1 Tax=Virgisporangium aurantiacum TaxID=175570 RepID=A0A8J4DY67_9ACTN|nr:hypothetical protein Vau01_028460 [Virgisporangium aurantiacum]
MDAEAAFQRVAMLTAAGDLAGARTALRHLGDRAEAGGQAVLASRALRLSATLDRALGDPNDAVATARRAAGHAESAVAEAATRAAGAAGGATAGPDINDARSGAGFGREGTPDRASYMYDGAAEVATAAYAELAESLVALGRAADAAAAYGKAAGHAASPATATALRRMQALALTSAGLGGEAAAILRDLAAEADDSTETASLLIQAAATSGSPTAPATSGENSVAAVGGTASPQIFDAARLLRDARDAVDAAGAAARDLRTDLAFVAASAALDDRDLPRALAEIRAARRHALDGVAVLQYIAAAVAESAVAELVGDDQSAYGSLATGYATLGDVVGKSLSAATFEGPLVRLRERWGAPRFARAKRAYEEKRRRVGSGR